MSRDRPAAPPTQTPVGRAALAARQRGLRVVLGDHLEAGALHGFVAEDDGWAPARGRVVACHDRFPSQTEPAAYAALVEALGDVPIGNPPSFTALCRDKVATQLRLVAAGVPMPELCVDPARFTERLEGWGAAFLKPRHGAFGRGVRRVVPGDPLPVRGVGAVPGVEDDLVLQRAVAPPQGWAGISIRLLAQLDASGRWVLGEPVARRHREDPVVNFARGAEAAPAEDVVAIETLDALREVAKQVVASFSSHPHTLEMGLDFVVEDGGRPWLVEVNGRPRGRMEALAGRDRARYAEHHLQACLRPLLRLASLATP